MKIKYIDVMNNQTMGCLQNNSSVGICLNETRNYSPIVYYLNDLQAEELFEKLKNVLIENKNNPRSEEIKNLFEL